MIQNIKFFLFFSAFQHANSELWSRDEPWCCWRDSGGVQEVVTPQGQRSGWGQWLPWLKVHFTETEEQNGTCSTQTEQSFSCSQISTPGLMWPSVPAVWHSNFNGKNTLSFTCSACFTLCCCSVQFPESGHKEHACMCCMFTQREAESCYQWVWVDEKPTESHCRSETRTERLTHKEPLKQTQPEWL